MKPFISVIVPIAPRFSSVQTRYENASIFFFVSPKIDRKSLKNRQFSFCPFSGHSVFSTFQSPYLPFCASKKDLKHFRTLSPYSSLFLPAIFRGIFRRFWWGGNQFLSLSHLKPTENPRKTSDFLRVHVKRLAGNVVIVAICEAK